MASPLVVPVCLLTDQMSLIDLEAVEVHIASLIKGFAATEKLLTITEIKDLVITMERRTAYKFTWKQFVKNSEIVENVFGILEECYSSIRLKSRNETSWKAARALGGRDTFRWQEFKIRVIEYLLTQGSFNNESGGYRDFEDTADGCDEITWDAACYLLQHPEWSPAN
jgi:hypothetical protein